MKDDLISRYLSNFLFVQIIFVQIISRFPDVIEKYYSNGLYVILSDLYRRAFGWIPFSIGDLFYTFLILLLIRFMYRLFRNRLTELRSYRMTIGATFSILYFLFYFSWGINYYRIPLATKLNIETKVYPIETLHAFSLKTIDKINKLHLSVVDNDTIPFEVPYTRKEIYTMAKSGYLELQKKEPTLKYKIPSIKHSLFSIPLSYMGFAGYLNPFTGEAQVNSKIPKYNLAFTVAHEMAHQIGYAAENEANFIAYLTNISHADPYFKLAGHLASLRYMVRELYKIDKEIFKSSMQNINPGIIKNLELSQTFWATYENPFEPIFKNSYDVYLKANKQKNGIQSYSYMVDLILNYHNKERSNDGA